MSAWGKSWGAAFGAAWGAIAPILPPIVGLRYVFQVDGFPRELYIKSSPSAFLDHDLSRAIELSTSPRDRLISSQVRSMAPTLQVRALSSDSNLRSFSASSCRDMSIAST